MRVAPTYGHFGTGPELSARLAEGYQQPMPCTSYMQMKADDSPSHGICRRAQVSHSHSHVSSEASTAQALKRPRLILPIRHDQFLISCDTILAVPSSPFSIQRYKPGNARHMLMNETQAIESALDAI